MCPICNSTEFTPLGKLGALVWVRCRCCGIEFHKEKPIRRRKTQ